MTCRWMPQFLTEAGKQDHVDHCLKMLKNFDGSRSKRVCDIITGSESCFTITIQRRSVKVKFDLQEIILSQAKFVENVLLANIFFSMKSYFNAIIPLENSYS